MKSLLINRIFQLALIGMFVFALGVPFIGTILSDKHTISASEKRQLADFPKFRWHSNANVKVKKALKEFSKAFKEFTIDFERYYNDHFFMRYQMVALNSLLRINLFETSPSFMGLVGSDGWLFLAGDGELHDFLRQDRVSDEKLKTWKQVIQQRRLLLSEWGGRYLLAVAPNKSAVYPELLPKRVQNNRGNYSELELVSRYLTTTHLKESFIDLSTVLLQEKIKNQVYFKTDTHWTDRGAFVSYMEIIRQLQTWYSGVVPVAYERLEPTLELERSGDLALILGLERYLKEDVEKLKIRKPCAKKEQAFAPDKQTEAFQLTMSGCTESSELRVLIIGDSFVDGLKQYFSETFAEVVYSREKEFNDLKDFILGYKPDIVLHLHVARYIDRACVLHPGLPVETRVSMFACP